MICTNAVTPIPSNSCFRGTQHEFVEVLAQLGAKIEREGSRGVETTLRRIRLTCRINAWAHALGTLATVTQQYGPCGLAY